MWVLLRIGKIQGESIGVVESLRYFMRKLDFDGIVVA